METQEATINTDSTVSVANENEVFTSYTRYRVAHNDIRLDPFSPALLFSMNGKTEGGTLRWIPDLRATGGYTVVVVRDPQTNRYHIGVSRCSKTDRFQRRTGRELALQRALQAQSEGRKISYPAPHNKEEKSALLDVLANIPMRFMLDDDNIREVRGRS